MKIMKNLFQLFSLYFYRLFVLIFSLIPFPVLNQFSRFISWLLRVVLHYRKDVITTNLNLAFPELDDFSKLRIIKAYYNYMGDLAIESIKGSSMSYKQLHKRFKATNPELLEKYYQNNQDVIIVTAHIGNWEWGAMMIGSLVPHLCLGIYKPLSNHYMDQYIKKSRSRFTTKLISMQEIREAIDAEYDEPYALVLVSDQSPKNMKRAIWTPIFNINTPFAHGLDDISHERKLPIIYVDIKKVKRGYYELTFDELIPDPNLYKRGEITAKYASHIESIVKTRPVDWLWSHKRWKRLTPPVYK